MAKTFDVDATLPRNICIIYGLLCIPSMAVITSLFNIALFINICECLIWDGTSYKNKSDKIVLSPLQIVDMVTKENMKKEAPRDWRTFIKRDKYISQTTTTELSDLTDDETLLKLRKVWSRWSKWGECSASCGGGVMRRQRVCVAGRCARGEREDQCRPCAREPCTQLPLEEPHELE